MKVTAQNTPIWKGLYKAAEAFRDFQPWEHYDDSFIFGIQDPESGEIGWCAIMGAAEEVFGLIVYIGDEGFEMLLDMIYTYEMEMFSDQEEEISTMVNQKYLKVEFVNKDETDAIDRKVFKDLGLKFKGKLQHISVRRHDPALFPWYIDESQAVFLTHCLEQTLKICEKALKGEIEMTDYDDDELLIMVAEKKDGKLNWKPGLIAQPEFEPEEDESKYIPDAFMINRIKKELKRKDAALFLVFRYLLNPIQETKGERPFFPKLALWVEGDAGMIIGNKVFSPNDFWAEFQNMVLETFYKLGYIPLNICVNSQMGMDIMEVYGEQLDLDIVLAPDHPLFIDLSESLGDFFG